jgi:pilus assembly protein CpaF
VRRYEDGVRRIESIAEITGLEGSTPLLQNIFAFHRQGRDGRRLTGDFQATGLVPHVVATLRNMAVEVPLELFQKRP